MNPQRGTALLEGLIALAVLSFGVLGLARFQVDMVKQTTDAQRRALAAALSEELLSYVRIDAANAACYTVPQTGTCGSTVAKKLATDWTAKVTGLNFATPAVTMPSTDRLKTSLSWTSQAFRDTRTQEATTDVRP
jgi:type IV pilus assembly protein PilV